MTTNREGIDAYVIEALGRERDELRAEVERLKTDPYKAGYIDGNHDAHSVRGESYSKCPRCSWSP